MSILQLCGDCDGRGSFECTYTCKKCNGEKHVPCPQCSGSGRVECNKCHGTGKSFLVFDCNVCRGSGIVQCRKCSGSGNIKCPTCLGYRHPRDCKICSGNGRIQCSGCNGKGKLPNKEIENWPIDKLKFEYENRQREILPMQTKIDYLHSEANRLYNEYDDHYGRYKELHGERAVGPYQQPDIVTNMEEEASRLSFQLRDKQVEMEIIHQVLSKKW